MLQVLITIDTEVYPINKDWTQDRLRRDLDRDIYGKVADREVGLNYQLGVLAKHGLKAVFMVESLFSGCPDVGLSPLSQIVSSIIGGGHEVQLHPHPEWIPYVPQIGLDYRSHLLRDFPLDEQARIIRFAKQQLELAGAPTPIAFRAGGFAANRNTLKALEMCNVRYDSSLNPCYENAHKYLPEARSFGQVTQFGAVQELPVMVFEDMPLHLRPAQLCAVSFAEMSLALEIAEQRGLEFAVIVSHSFEMVGNRWNSKRSPVIREQVVRRFEALCEFLAKNTHRFRTVGFADVVLRNSAQPLESIRGNLVQTALRMARQAAARIG